MIHSDEFFTLQKKHIKTIEDTRVALHCIYLSFYIEEYLHSLKQLLLVFAPHTILKHPMELILEQFNRK